MNTTLIERTITTPAGGIGVALFHVVNARGVVWFEVSVRDNRLFPNSYVGQWLSIRTFADESAARVFFADWYAQEKRLSGV